MKWRSKDGKVHNIAQMNSIHLENAMKQTIRRISVRFYDDRFKLGYVRTPPFWYSRDKIRQRLDKSRIYTALLEELAHRTEALFITHYIREMDILCRKEWSLYFQFQKVTTRLRK